MVRAQSTRTVELTQQYVKSNSWHVLITLETFSPTNRAMFQSCEPAEEPARLVVQANDKEGIAVSFAPARDAVFK